MRKEIQKDGSTSQKIRITSEDMKLYELNIGDVVELTITEVIKVEQTVKNKEEKRGRQHVRKTKKIK